MDGQRFDELTRTAAGTSRRRALRLLGGGLAAALLGAGGRAARAQTGAPPIFSACNNGFVGTTGAGVVNPSGAASPDTHKYAEEGRFELMLPCGGDGDCPQGRTCVSGLNPSDRIVCRCVDLCQELGYC